MNISIRPRVPTMSGNYGQTNKVSHGYFLRQCLSATSTTGPNNSPCTPKALSPGVERQILGVKNSARVIQ